jgi:hypothetical protein
MILFIILFPMAEGVRRHPAVDLYKWFTWRRETLSARWRNPAYRQA